MAATSLGGDDRHIATRTWREGSEELRSSTTIRVGVDLDLAQSPARNHPMDGGRPHSLGRRHPRTAE